MFYACRQTVFNLGKGLDIGFTDRVQLDTNGVRELRVCSRLSSLRIRREMGPPPQKFLGSGQIALLQDLHSAPGEYRFPS